MSQQQRNIVVVKIGSSTLVGSDGRLDASYIDKLAFRIASIRKAGWQPIIVTSAAIACGVEALGLACRPSDMPGLQAAASIGQRVLSQQYARSFEAYDITTSIVLLTRHDTASRHAYLHARDALLRLCDFGVVPIVNENDTTSVEEIRFGDNDTLAALVACLVKAKLCVLFSDIEGLYTANPAKDPTATLLHHVDRITPEILAIAGGAGSAHGTGGMETKVRAARVLLVAGIPMVICHGRNPESLEALIAGESVGTRFEGDGSPHEITNYKLWIALGDSPHGALVVDDGARDALVNKGKSLLCVGIKQVKGAFEAGSIVDVLDLKHHVIARGKCSASHDELELARGFSSAQMAANRLLAPLARTPVIHRDEMVVFD